MKNERKLNCYGGPEPEQNTAQVTLESFGYDASVSHHSRVSSAFRTAGFALAVLTVVLSVVLIISYSGYVTYDNFEYIAKTFSYVRGNDGESADSFTVSAGSGMVCGCFGDNLVFAGSGRLDVYSPSGKLKYSYDTGMTAPVLVGSGSRFAVFSPGENRVGVYNSITRFADIDLGAPVYSVDLSDGLLAVLSESGESHTTVSLYRSDMSSAGTLSYRDAYGVKTAVSSGSSYVALLSVKSSGGSVTSVIDIYDAALEQKHHEEMTGELPFDIWFAGETLFAVTDRCVRTMDVSADDISSVSDSFAYTGMTYMGRQEAEGTSLLYFSEKLQGFSDTIIAFDTKGAMIGKTVSELPFVSSAMIGGVLVYDSAGKVTATDFVTSRDTDYPSGGILFSGESGLYSLGTDHILKKLK